MSTSLMPRVIAFGASISAWSFDSKGQKGFGDAFRKHFEGRAVVENKGYPGGTSLTLQQNFRHILDSIRSKPSQPILLITIFIGANDAALVSADQEALVPIDEYEANMRGFIDQLLTSDLEPLKKTRIIVVAIPPVNCPDPLDRFRNRNLTEAQETIFFESLEAGARQGLVFKTWVNKLRYAEKVVEIVESYRGAGEDRVHAVNLWRAIMRYGLELQGQNEELEMPLDVGVKGKKWPGCGLPGAGMFERNVFVDGLHLGEKGNEILTTEIVKLVDDL